MHFQHLVGEASRPETEEDALRRYKEILWYMYENDQPNRVLHFLLQIPVFLCCLLGRSGNAMSVLTGRGLPLLFCTFLVSFVSMAPSRFSRIRQLLKCMTPLVLLLLTSKKHHPEFILGRLGNFSSGHDMTHNVMLLVQKYFDHQCHHTKAKNHAAATRTTSHVITT